MGFCGHHVVVDGYGEGASDFINFLCCDLVADAQSELQANYEFMLSGELSLWLEGRCLYAGTSRYDLAYSLINEIIHHCIVDNDSGHAIHAAAIATPRGAVLLPGSSGAGKSTFTTWMLSRGCNYLTDELVVLGGENGQLLPFTRPLSIKQGSFSVLESFLDCDSADSIKGSAGLMLPHRFINANFSATVPPLALILFPEYRAGATTELIQIPPGLGCARLMECYVNARNLKGHGIGGLAEITRNTPAYSLQYGSFHGLAHVLSEALPALFGELKR